MAINFCLPMYKPKITCSTVSADGYEIDNLISPDFRRSCKGFMAESFIKPPVTITLEFICNISIHSIVIAPSVGQQRSSSFEIYTKSIPSQSRLLNPEICSNLERRTGQSSNSPITYDATEVLVGKGFSQDPNINLFHFENKKFYAREPFMNIPNRLSKNESNLIKRQLHHHRSKPLADVSHMTIRIVRVFGATVPCVKMLEVWGQPSYSNSQFVLDSIVKIDCESNLKPSKEVPKDQEKQKAKSNGNYFDSSFKCPEEFIDPITLEVMALPVLLPSGHTVDQSTLDQYEISNAQWGRPKSDPYTGVPFSDTLKPIPNVRLKTRIDRFLLTAGKDFDTVARTSGRTSDNNNACTSKITLGKITGNSVKQSNEKHPNEIHTFNTQSLAVQKWSHLENDHQMNRYGSGVVIDSSKPVYATNQSNLRIPAKRNCSVIDVSTQPVNKVRKIEKAATHEQKLADSLEAAMNSILATRPNYRKINISNLSESTNHVCVACNSQPSSRKTFYRLPCQHLMCRYCVTNNQGNAKCTACGVAFSNFDIMRVHLT